LVFVVALTGLGEGYEGDEVGDADAVDLSKIAFEDTVFEFL
jgi:hypothetical protein